MVVTETATPTPGAGAGLEREHPGDACRERDDDRLVADRRQRPEHGGMDVESRGDQPEDVLQRRGQARRGRGERHPDQEGHERPRGEAETAVDQPDTDRRDREEVGADRHRPDDQDHVGVDHAVAPDDARDDHEREVPRDRSGVPARHAEHVLPDEPRLGSGTARAPEHLLAGQRHLVVGRAVPPQVVHHAVHRAGADDGDDDGVPRLRRVDEPHARHVLAPVEELCDGRHRLGLAEDLEPDHRRPAGVTPTVVRRPPGYSSCRGGPACVTVAMWGRRRSSDRGDERRPALPDDRSRLA